jgi:hypothetical protein
MKECTRCKGAGQVADYFKPGEFRKCHYCDGRGTFPAVDVSGILAAIVSTRGKERGKLKKSRPDYKAGGRAYYVWRMARFNGGADVCMPIMAMGDVEGDPYIDVLDKLADAVAQRAFGTKFAAAARWGMALGMLQSVPAGLPSSAYPGGPAGTDIGSIADSPEFHTDRYSEAVESGDDETAAEYQDLPLFAGV